MSLEVLQILAAQGSESYLWRFLPMKRVAAASVGPYTGEGHLRNTETSVEDACTTVMYPRLLFTLPDICFHAASLPTYLPRRTLLQQQPTIAVKQEHRERPVQQPLRLLRTKAVRVAL